MANNGRVKRMHYYPWKEWFRKKTIRLRRHKDYSCIDSHFVVVARRRATQYGIELSAHVGEGWVELIVHSRQKGWEKKVGGRNQ